MIGPPDWPAGDRRRQSVKGRPKVDDRIPPVPDDVRSTYGHRYVHDYDWYKGPKPFVYVRGYRRHLVGGDVVWDQYEDTLRLVKKDDASHSVIIPGLDDFWLLDGGNPDFIYLDNMRKGLQRVVYIVPREHLVALRKHLQVVPAQVDVED